MVLDQFRFMTDQEIEKRINGYWEDLEYLVKIRILLKAFPGYSITKLESRGIGKLWKALSLKKQKEIYQDSFRYQIPGQ